MTRGQLEQTELVLGFTVLALEVAELIAGPTVPEEGLTSELMSRE